jgi:acetyl esterase
VLAGPPVHRDGQRLDVDMQVFLRLQRLTGRGLVDTTPEHARREVEEGDVILRGPLVQPVETRDLTIQDGLAARLYTPPDPAPGDGLLVYYHGGGWVVGSLDSHDNVCRFLARHAAVRVLSVAYRLAPEHPFPVAVEDAYTGFRYARRHAAELGANPDLIAVGGDSAGGNLAIAAGLQAARDGAPGPAYQLLIYPATDHTTRRRSRELYGQGFFLTDASMTWYGDHYAGSADRADPLLSPLLARNLGELAPAYVAVAGFDPLCDEGEAFADKLAAAGVPVTPRRFDDLIHGYANFIGFSARAREAMLDAATALGQALAAPRRGVADRDAS